MDEKKMRYEVALEMLKILIEPHGICEAIDICVDANGNVYQPRMVDKYKVAIQIADGFINTLRDFENEKSE